MFHQILLLLLLLPSLISSLQTVPPGTGTTRLFKDQGVNGHVFPPIVYHDPAGVLPPGHLRPLGYQRISDGPITAHSGCVESESFWEEYVMYHKPLLMRRCGLYTDDDRREWIDSVMKSRYRKTKVPVIQAKLGMKLVNIEKFIKNYNYESWIVESMVPEILRERIHLPEMLRCGDFAHLIQFISWYWASGNTGRPIRYQPDHQIQCNIDGRVDYVFIHPEHKKKLNMVQEYEAGCKCGESDMDVNMVSVFKYKKMSDVRWKWATSRPGDCVFIPAGHIYHTRSYGHALTVTFHVTPVPKVRIGDCLPENTTMNDYQLLYTHHAGKKFLDFEAFDTVLIRRWLFSLMRHDESLKWEDFRIGFATLLGEVVVMPAEYYATTMFEEEEEKQGKVGDKLAREAWKLLDDRRRGHLTREDVITMPRGTLEGALKPFNSAMWGAETSKVSLVLEDDEEDQRSSHLPRHVEL